MWTHIRLPSTKWTHQASKYDVNTHQATKPGVNTHHTQWPDRYVRNKTEGKTASFSYPFHCLSTKTVCAMKISLLKTCKLFHVVLSNVHSFFRLKWVLIKLKADLSIQTVDSSKSVCADNVDNGSFQHWNTIRVSPHIWQFKEWETDQLWRKKRTECPQNKILFMPCANSFSCFILLMCCARQMNQN